ncbi:hypothetical protein MUY27_00205 [Mucilaginibacter sp. RS28]|uniref:Uncharacterized protein n=1 Tax=Mucilaginibacter straminoryzae TaxID=2932774 RepID=A0A9X1WZP3_9SPHI|nr:hypothetical protein [Mucilaginibacter straminoryzae]MCJ8208106.1 hypothetical protein [Mucilaginibacter straminoryzae]
MKPEQLKGAAIALLRIVFCGWLLLLVVIAVAVTYLLAAPFFVLRYLFIPSKTSYER